MGKKILKTWVYSIIAEQVKDSLWPWDWNIPKQDSSTKAYHTVIAKNMQNGHSLLKGWINRKRPHSKGESKRLVLYPLYKDWIKFYLV